MLNEFCSLTGAVQNKFKMNWEIYEKQIIKYAPFETKESVKNLVTKYNLKKDCSLGMWYNYTQWIIVKIYSDLKINAQLLHCKYLCNAWAETKGKLLFQCLKYVFYFYINYTLSIDIDVTISALSKEPSIAIIEGDIKVIIEENVFDMPSVETALYFCFSTYYVFNISYPLVARNVFLFLEKLVFNLSSVSKLPVSVIVFNDNLQRAQSQ